jgi:acyl-CoA thioesterase-1
MARTAIAKRILLAFGIVALMASLSFMGLFLAHLSSKENSADLIHVACVGDSITESSGYPENLQTMLGDSYRVGNFGVSGSTVRLNSDLPYMDQPAFEKAKAFQPSIMVIMLGTNDATENVTDSVKEFQSDYQKLVDECQVLESNPSIWLVKPPPISENGLNLNDTNLKCDVIPCIENVANELNLPIIDINAVMTNYPQYFMDGVHPSSEGAMLIANEINQVITLNDTTTPPF